MVRPPLNVDPYEWVRQREQRRQTAALPPEASRSDEHLSLDGIEASTGAAVSEAHGLYRLTWPDGAHLLFHRDGVVVHYDYMYSPMSRSLVCELAGVLPAFFREKAISHFRTTVSDSPEFLTAIGFEAQTDGSFICDISPGGRMDAYVGRRRAMPGTHPE